VTPRRTTMVLAALALVALASCQTGPGQPGTAVREFYAAALRGDTLAVRRHSADERGRNAGEVIRAATGEGAVKRVEGVDVDVWAEHGAHCAVRKTLANGTPVLVRIEVTRKHGAWKVTSGIPDL
jgi:hypothetical protein